MRGRILLAIGVVAAVACSDGSNSENSANEKGSNSGSGATLTGTVYGFTATPDSQRVAIEGATVTLVRVGDFVPPSPGPDTTGGPTPPGGDTTFMVRRSLRSLIDTSSGPPPEAPPLPGCGMGVEVATATSGSDGSWSATGLEAGVYNVAIAGPAGGHWSSIEYCGLPVTDDGENDITLYLQPGPGPDPVP